MFDVVSPSQIIGYVEAKQLLARGFDDDIMSDLDLSGLVVLASIGVEKQKFCFVFVGYEKIAGHKGHYLFSIRRRQLA